MYGEYFVGRGKTHFSDVYASNKLISDCQLGNILGEKPKKYLFIVHVCGMTKLLKYKAWEDILYARFILVAVVVSDTPRTLMLRLIAVADRLSKPWLYACAMASVVNKSWNKYYSIRY